MIVNDLSTNMTAENFEKTNHLVLNFYSDGYTIAIKLNEFPVFTSETILETAKIPYEETSLLDYIENEELPPLLVEMIDASPKLNQYKIWHNGCLILEVRDKIQTFNRRNFDKFSLDAESAKSVNIGSLFILLKPTNLSMLNDVQNLTDSESWSTQDRLQLESKIVLHSSPPLSLDPKVTEKSSDRGDIWPYSKPINAYTKLKKKLPHARCRSAPPAQVCHENLPPELSLQHFIATKRAKRRFGPGNLPKFHRFLYRNNNTER